MPNTVLEAYAYGKPVVASRLGSLTEIVEDKKTGFLFEPKNSHELSEILKRFMDDETLSEQMGREARKKCEREFGEDMHMKRVISCLKGA